MKASPSVPILRTGEVRLIAHEPELLASRLAIGSIIMAGSLPDAALRDEYPPNALVPDPRTIRPCTDAEAGRVIVPVQNVDPARRRDTDVLLYVGETGTAALMGRLATIQKDRWFGGKPQEQGQLTTTRNEDITEGPDKEGLHFDTGEEFAHRLGMCVAGPRHVLVGGAGARDLLGADVEPWTERIRRKFSDDMALREAPPCLFVRLEALEGYDAYTRAILHDGSTWDITKTGDGSAPSSIIFARL